MNFQKLAIVLLLLISQLVFALPSNQPATCPDPKTLAAVGVNETFHSNDDAWVTYRASHSFGTANKWTLMVLIQARDSHMQ
ncbi:hypothetical protein [Legionella gresilensis]|uniref:hypothetical protein n=1 Tax=Legionella gresilensis TaxID=91823 RepID=UPI00104189F6|nr:hypothetical protein [Legionella gresilensis]